MRDITLGQFIAGNSLIHQCDPRTKIVIMIVYIAMVFFVESIPAFAIPFVFLIVSLLLSKIPVSYILKSLKPIRLLLIFMFILNSGGVNNGYKRKSAKGLETQGPSCGGIHQG